MKKLLPILTVAILLSLGTLAEAASFSFDGFFVQDDDVQLFSFYIGQTSNITLKTYSFTGGVNSVGTTIAGGGFDPILALFSGSEATKNSFIAFNDDTPFNTPDPATGESWDSYVNAILGPGNYTVALVQYDNFYKSGQWDPNAPVFKRQGQGNFTPALSGAPQGTTTPFWINNDDPFLPPTQRTGYWAVDILGADSADPQNNSTVPEPATMGLLGLGLAGFFLKRKK